MANKRNFKNKRASGTKNKTKSKGTGHKILKSYRTLIG